MKYDVAIIGGGPAGLTAGIYAARGGLSVAIIEKQGIGGQAALTSEIENYPGVETSSGFELTLKMQEQAERFGVNFVYEEVLALHLAKNPKQIVTQNSIIEASSVILCMGASPRNLGLAREMEFIGGGVSYCATCDGAFFRGKNVAVNGGGNTAVEDALYLERFASKVYLIHRRNELRADKILAERIKSSTINVIWDSVIKELEGDKKLSAIKISNVKSGEESELKLDGLFVAVGQVPSSTLATEIDRNEKGYLITKDDMSTNIEGVYAAGDLRQKTLRQVVTACADGAIAADSVSKWLTEQKK
ncbi:MAG: thioredoxin-disulfide reductase [Clostridia bacterium]|nr:thioredoxin-disulfide reductase [Clostridia bacterium]